MLEANLKELEDAGLAFIVGARIPDVPYQVKKWRQTHLGEPIPDGQVFVQPTVMGPKADQRHRMIFYQHRRPGDPHPARDRRADREGGEGDQGSGCGQTEPVRPADRRHPHNQPRPRGHDPRSRGFEGLPHQPARADTGVRAGRLPAAVADREELPDVQVRPARPADLPPQTQVDRGPA
jgi:hypothetical protein